MYKFLTTDIISHCDRNKIYGKRGDMVLICTNGIDVKIVQSESGGRYSCRDEFMSDTPIIGAATVEVKQVEKVVRLSKKPLTQAQKLQIEYLNTLK